MLKISSGWSKGKAAEQQSYIGCGSCEGPLFHEEKAGYLLEVVMT
jgi:hypothetical protein